MLQRPKANRVIARSSSGLAAAAAVVLAGLTAPAHAANYYWDAAGVTTATTHTATNGAGTWSTTNKNWINGAVTSSVTDIVWAAGNAAVFGAASSTGTGGAINVSGAQSASAISVATAGYVFSGSAITLGTNSVNAFSQNAEFDNTLNFAGSTTNTNITAGKTLTLVGGGTLAGDYNGSTSSSSTAAINLTGGTYTQSTTIDLEDTITQTGSSSFTSSNAGLFIGYKTANTGANGFGTWVLNDANATMTLNNGGSIARQNGTGKLDIKLGTFSSAAGLTVGYGGGTTSANFLVEGGAATITGGSVAIGNNAASVTAATTISGGVTTVDGIAFNGTTYTSGTSTASLNVSGGALYIGANGIVLNGNTTGGTFNASVNLTGGIVGAAANWSSAMGMNLASGTTTFQAADASASPIAHNITLSGALTGGGALTKTGGGTLTLATANGYTGATTISAGTLALGSAGSLASTTESIATGATFDISARPAYSFAGVSDTIGIGAASGSNGFVNGGSTTALTYGGALTLNLAAVLSSNSSFDLFDFASEGGDLDSITLSGAYSGSLTNSGGTWTGSSGNASFSFSESNGVLTVAVPEPAALSVLACSALGLLVRRRRTVI